MKETRPNPSDEPKKWVGGLVRIIRRVVNLGVMDWTGQRIAKLRLSGFMLRRSDLGKRFALGVGKLRFFTARFRHSQGEQVYSIRRGTSAIWNLASLACSPLVWAAFVIAVFVGVPMQYDMLATSQGWTPLPMPAVKSETYLAFLGTVGPTAAGLLALFFTAISVVASTSYAKVPTDIRLLVAQDDLNRRYLCLLAHTAAVALIGVALHALGVPPSTALAGYVIVIACVCLLAFFPLGVRTFALFDPSTLAGRPVQKFGRAVRSVRRHGRRWLDPSFQNHANVVAGQQLRLLADLVQFGITEDRPSHKVVLDLATSVNRLARLYTTKKPGIPSDSLWFTRRAEFERWEVASSSMTAVALQTGVAPHPEAIPDHGFVEARCTEMTIRCLRRLLARDAIGEAVDVLVQINSTATAYARLFGQAESIQLVAATRNILVDHLKSADPTVEPLKQFHLVDIQCVAALAPILNAAIPLTEEPVEKLVCHEDGLLRLNRRRLCSTTHPRCVLNSAEDLLQRLEFEKSVEGVIRTQPWYIRQVIALGYAEAIREVIGGIVKTVEQEFVEPATGLIHAKRAPPAGWWLQRGIEACRKAKHRIEALEDRYAELKGFHVTEVPWLTSGAEEALPKIEGARGKIVRLLAGIVPDLCQMPAGGSLPDLPGQTRAQVAEELILLMERKQEDGFAELFVSYFKATTAVCDHFLDLAQQPGKQDYIRVAMDAMLDLMDVSGLAFLFTELNGTRFRSVVTRAWDLYFDQAADKPAMVKAWYGAVGSRLTLPIFSSSAMQRQEWGQRFAHTMADQGIDADRHYGMPRGRRRVAPHPSSVIESIIVNLGHLTTGAHDYFGALYLSAREEAKGIKMPSEIEHCIHTIERAKARRKEPRDEKTQGEPLEK